MSSTLPHPFSPLWPLYPEGLLHTLLSKGCCLSWRLSVPLPFCLLTWCGWCLILLLRAGLTRTGTQGLIGQRHPSPSDPQCVSETQAGLQDRKRDKPTRYPLTNTSYFFSASVIHSFSTCAAKTGPPTITRANVTATVTSGSSGRHASSCRYDPGGGKGEPPLQRQVVRVPSMPCTNVRDTPHNPLLACA